MILIEGSRIPQIAAEGWAAVKSYSMLNEATYRALADAARAAGLQLVGRIPEQVSLGTAIEVEQAGMEHFGRVAMACSTRKAEMISAIQEAIARNASTSEVFGLMADRNAIILDRWDEERCRDVLSRMADADMHVSPTLVVADFYTGNWPSSDSPAMRMIPATVREARDQPDFRREAMTEEVLALAEATLALGRETFAMAHDAGVPILASTDASFANRNLIHGFSLQDELDIYVGADLTSAGGSIHRNPRAPQFFGRLDQDRTIAPDRRADLVTSPTTDGIRWRCPVGSRCAGRA